MEGVRGIKGWNESLVQDRGRAKRKPQVNDGESAMKHSKVGTMKLYGNKITAGQTNKRMDEQIPPMYCRTLSP